MAIRPYGRGVGVTPYIFGKNHPIKQVNQVPQHWRGLIYQVEWDYILLVIGVYDVSF